MGVLKGTYTIHGGFSIAMFDHQRAHLRYMEIELEIINIFCFFAVTPDPEKNAEKGSMPLTILGSELTCLSLLRTAICFAMIQVKVIFG